MWGETHCRRESLSHFFRSMRKFGEVCRCCPSANHTCHVAGAHPGLDLRAILAQQSRHVCKILCRAIMILRVEPSFKIEFHFAQHLLFSLCCQLRVLDHRSVVLGFFERKRGKIRFEPLIVREHLECITEINSDYHELILC